MANKKKKKKKIARTIYLDANGGARLGQEELREICAAVAKDHSANRLHRSADGATYMVRVGNDGSLLIEKAEQFERNPPVPASPPLNAQMLLDLFLPSHLVDNVLGDLQECHSKKLKRLGKARADLWYWKQVFTSLWPIAGDGARRVSRSCAFRILCLVLRLLGQSGWADALKTAEDERKRIS